MGFFKKLKKAFNPIEQTKQLVNDPKQALKNAGAMGLDPAGSVVRAGTTGNMAPQNARQMIDPSGKILMPEQQAAPKAGYTPGPMQLSPGAQALYDDMKARMAARAAGQNYTPPAAAPSPGYAPTGSGGVRPIMQTGTPQMSAPLNAPKPLPVTTRPIETAAPAAAAGVPARAQSFKGLSGVPMADGGKVGGHQTFTNKAFTRKPNGKPC